MCRKPNIPTVPIYPANVNVDMTCGYNSHDSKVKLIFQVDLGTTEQYWTGWYSGMSKLFLSVSAPKLLLLAGPDRLDTELTVAHMQVKIWSALNSTENGHSKVEDPDPLKSMLRI